MEKLVSIIIPAYNTEKYIGNCIESVIKQTYHNLEVIIVNDGSEDNTLEIITKARLRDNRIVVINQENNGPSAARNAGLKICRGDYVFFLDSDDWLSPNCIEKLISIEKKKKGDIIFFDYYKNFAGKDIEHFTYKKDFYYRVSKNSALWDMRTITPWGKLYSRKCIEGIYFDEQMKTAEDVDFNLLYSDTYLSVKSELAEGAVMNSNNTVTVKNNQGKFKVMLASNKIDENKFTIYTISGDENNHGDIVIHLTDKGIKVDGENIENIKIDAENKEKKDTIVISDKKTAEYVDSGDKLESINENTNIKEPVITKTETTPIKSKVVSTGDTTHIYAYVALTVVSMYALYLIKKWKLHQR